MPRILPVTIKPTTIKRGSNTSKTVMPVKQLAQYIQKNIDFIMENATPKRKFHLPELADSEIKKLSLAVKNIEGQDNKALSLLFDDTGSVAKLYIAPKEKIVQEVKSKSFLDRFKDRIEAMRYCLHENPRGHL